MRIIALRPARLAISLAALLVAAPAFAEEGPAVQAAPLQAPAEALPPLDPPIEVAPAPALSSLPRTAPAAPAAVPAAKPRAAQARPAPRAKPLAQGNPTVQAKPASQSAAKPAAPLAPPEPIRLSEDPRPTLTPQTFAATLKAAERYRALAEAGGWPTVPGEAIRLKPGSAGSAVAALKKRLAVTGDLQDHELAGNFFDDGVAAGIRRFQARHGLEPTGTVGPRTLVHLNIPAAMRVRQLEASAGRLTKLRFPFGDRYVVVNIPGAAVEAVERGVVAHRFVAVVGRPERPSPEIETRVTSVNFNPTWTVPVSIIKKDIIPHVRKEPGYLAKMHIRIFDGQGQEVDPATIDWSTERAANYTIRQDSGSDNSLGEIRIDMPNRHAVYMHDTPSKRLFARSLRAQSSGCVRVSGVKGLAAWLLETSPGPRGPGSSWTPMEIETAIAGGKRVDARLSKPVPVAWIYLTGYASADGTAHFRDDVYGIDEPKPAGTEPPAPLPDPATTSSLGPRKQAQREQHGRM
ncbi:L,D-transpeptidase family protein [Enterovirga sp.]|uniref:L,D-transpeptidase family protein n=1 Tax=Enterovirga sp. TaxID=2026350 RepID=UPI002BCE5DE5|nr:L,D-transpeptidase family protein [Enterovirga sp.]HMO28790.1 L,D-transpeptidase family protein [Enterovirga sp.]